MHLKECLEAYLPDTSLSKNDYLSEFVSFYNSHFREDIFSFDIFIIGVPEGRLSPQNESCATAPDEVRSELYRLYRGDWTMKILDLGNLKLGYEVRDTYALLQELSSYLLQVGKLILVLGGGHDLIQPIYKGHSFFEKPLNFASADAYLDFQDGDAYDSRSFLSQLLTSEGSLISKYSLLGYQTYLCSPNELALLNQMDVQLVRLAEMNSDVTEIEPYLRDLDHLSIDLSVVKSAEAPANRYSSPNGLSSTSLCAMLRYAGMSSRVKTVLFSELNPQLDREAQSAKVFAQALWYFLEGYQLRVEELPEQESNNFQKFHVSSDLSDLVFYKSKISSRWWVSLPKKESLLPCSFLDYKNAVDGILSDRLLSYVKF